MGIELLVVRTDLKNRIGSSIFAYKHRSLGGLSKMADNWLQNLLITNNELLDPVLFLRSVHISIEFCKHGLLPLANQNFYFVFSSSRIVLCTLQLEMLGRG